MKNQRGVTLIELLIVAGIIGLVAFIAFNDFAYQKRMAPFQVFEKHFGIDPHSFGATFERHIPADPAFSSKREIVQLYINIQLREICVYPADLPTQGEAELSSEELMELMQELQRVQQIRDEVDRRCAEAISAAEGFGFEATSPY